MGNYLLTATEVVKRHTKALGLPPARTYDRGNRLVPWTRHPDCPLKMQTIRINAKWDYASIVLFIRALEQTYPLAEVTGLRLWGRGRESTLVQMDLSVTWPAWDDEKKAAALLATVMDTGDAPGAVPKMAKLPRMNDPFARPGTGARASRQPRVTGIMKGAGGTYVAIVEGKPVGVGDTVETREGARTFTWRIRTITAKGVTFDPVNP
jgi:hypothetical protein